MQEAAQDAADARRDVDEAARDVSEAAREAKLEQLHRQFVYYRKGDRPSFVLERVNRERPDER